MSDPNFPGAEPSQPDPALPVPPAAPQPADAQQVADQAPAAPAFPAAPEAPAAPAAQSFPQPPAYAAAPPAPPVGTPGAPYAGGPGAPQQAPTNTLAIVALIASFFVSIVGIICGHIALGQIKRTGERGRGLALAGTIIGYVSFGITVISVIFLIVVGGLAAAAGSSSLSSSLSELEDATSELEATVPGTTVPDAGALPEATEGSGTADLPRSAEFCTAFNDILASQNDSSSADFTAEDIAAFTSLSKIDSPNQDVYKAIANLASGGDFDPTTGETLVGDLMTAMMEDGMACL